MFSYTQMSLLTRYLLVFTLAIVSVFGQTQQANPVTTPDPRSCPAALKNEKFPLSTISASIEFEKICIKALPLIATETMLLEKTRQELEAAVVAEWFPVVNLSLKRQEYMDIGAALHRKRIGFIALSFQVNLPGFDKTDQAIRDEYISWKKKADAVMEVQEIDSKLVMAATAEVKRRLKEEATYPKNPLTPALKI